MRNPNENQMQRVLARAEEIWATADGEGRPPTPDERREIARCLKKIDHLRTSGDARMLLDGTGGAASVTPTDPRAANGGGWEMLAKGIDPAKGQTRAEAPLGTLLRGKALTGADDPLGFEVKRGALVQLGFDARFVYPVLAREGLAPQNLSVSDWRQTGRSVTGSVERDPFSTTTKAELDVVVEHVSEDVRQVAVVISDVPNAVMQASRTLVAFLHLEGQLQLDVAIDAHVLSQIDAAAPPFGLDGEDLIAQVRNAISAMRAVGANPTTLVLAPGDAAALDLTQVGADDLYLFPTRDSGSSSPLYGLTIIESPNVVDPLLLDPQRLGVLYAGQLSIEADPYSGFDQNVTRLRLEANCLFHVRDATGAYEIASGS